MGMDGTKTALERAFELARSGRFASASDVKLAIGREGYAVSQLQGPRLMRQLAELIRAARAANAGDT